MRHPLILGSSSLVRSRILSAAGVYHDVCPAGLAEQEIRCEMVNEDGATVALELAVRKAELVSRKFPGAWVIGCDQVLVCDAVVMGKPDDDIEALSQLTFLRGKHHELPTAICAASNGTVQWKYVETPKLTMRNFTDNFLQEYLSVAGEALSSPGAYQLEGMGASLFEQIEGDYFTILGLPLLPLLSFLRDQRELPK